MIFALCGWVAGALVLGTNQDTTFLGALWTPWTLRSAVAAGVAAVVWGPLLAWARLRWYLGALVGLVAGLTALYLFFFIWPPDMQDGRLEAWKTAGLFISVYWRFLIPASIVAGAGAAEWTRWPVRTPRWQQIADGDDLPEIPVPAPPRPPPEESP